MLRLENLFLPLGQFALDVNVTISSPVTAVFGPSGSGKTSLLDLIAGLRRPRKGAIRLDDTIMCDQARGAFLPPRLRGVGYVPQDLALFPHLDVRKNLLYGYRDLPASNPLFRFEHIVEVLEIAGLLDRRVDFLSGGEKQRVAFARALLSSPRLLLLDEPMSSLDARLKERLVPYLRRIRDEFHLPMIYVTHDLEELQTLCDDVLLMSQGQVTFFGSVAQAFSKPGEKD